MSVAPSYKRWSVNQADEDGMNEGHSEIWARMIEHSGIDDLAGKSVLDFGCNQGGFLRLLSKTLPFDHAVGVDLALDSLQVARDRKPETASIVYEHASWLDDKADYFDFAFSHEVIYLMPSLVDHARTIGRVLKPGGHYFAVTGCHMENPLWPRWRKEAAAYTHTPIPDYALNDFADAFLTEGFTAGMMQLKPTTFMSIEPPSGTYNSLFERLEYHNNHKIMFRFTKPREDRIS